jgi:hypothetical protein|tara:strand:- start:130 stop:630 length:501 start_codon:yes stop_codon:yes gene_type:complete
LPNDSVPGQKRILRWLQTNQGIGFVLSLVLFLYFIFLQLSPWVHEKLRDGFSLGFFPLTGIVLMLLFTVTLIFDGERNKVIPDLTKMSGRSFLFCLAVLAGCGLYFSLIVSIGFLLVSPFFLLAFMYLLGLRPFSHCIVSGVVMTIIVYVVFRLIGVRLPSGILPF